MGEVRVYEGKVAITNNYASPPYTYIGVNSNYPEYYRGNRFQITKFTKGLEGKRVRLTLEVLD